MDAVALSQPLECPVCMECFNCTTTIPKVLGTCGHSVCEPCINRCVRDEEAECPECRQVSQAPANGFPSNFGLLSKLAAEATANLERDSTTIKCSGCEESVPKAKAFVCATCPAGNEVVESTLSLAERFLKHCRTVNRDATAASDNVEGPQVEVSRTQRLPFLARIRAPTSGPSTSATGSDESDIDNLDSTHSQLDDDPSVAPAVRKKRRLHQE